MNYKIENNFLDKKQLDYFNNTILSNIFPWFLNGINFKEDYQKQFVHIFYKNDDFSSNYKELIFPILNIINPISIYRVKLNLLTKTNDIIEHPFHQDHSSKNLTSSILYLNTNNGYTGFENNIKSFSEKNTLITFSSNKLHHGTTCTDQEFRIVLNLVYVK